MGMEITKEKARQLEQLGYRRRPGGASNGFRSVFSMYDPVFRFTYEIFSGPLNKLGGIIYDDRQIKCRYYEKDVATLHEKLRKMMQLCLEKGR